MIVVICGFSGSGKDTITDSIESTNDYHKVISTTSRPIRENECEGNPYYFTDSVEFIKMLNNNEFIECREYDTLVDGIPDTWYYGIHQDHMNDRDNYVVVLDMLGLMEIKEQFGDSVISFFIDVDEPERLYRAQKNRTDFDKIEWDRRYVDDKTQFPPDMINREVDHIIKNDELDICVRDIINKITYDEGCKKYGHCNRQRKY